MKKRKRVRRRSSHLGTPSRKYMLKLMRFKFRRGDTFVKRCRVHILAEQLLQLPLQLLSFMNQFIAFTQEVEARPKELSDGC